MSLIGDAQEFLYYQKPQGTNTQFPPRGGVRNVSASYITGGKMPSRPEQDVSQQYTTLKREGERAAGILNTPALTSPLNEMIQEPSDVEQARGYLGMAQTGVNALVGTDLAKSAFGSALKNVGGGLGAVNAGLSAYNIAQRKQRKQEKGRGTAKDLEAASKVAGKSATGSTLASAIGEGLGALLRSIIGEGAAILSGGLSEIFCFAEGTPITMADGTTKPVEQIDLFDVCEGGGMVNGKGVVIAEDIYDYEGVMVTGGHAVYEDNKWIRVKDSEKSILVALEEPIKVYIVNNEEHVLIINDIIFADYGEVTDSENMTADERLAYLNDNCSF